MPIHITENEAGVSDILQSVVQPRILHISWFSASIINDYAFNKLDLTVDQLKY